MNIFVENLLFFVIAFLSILGCFYIVSEYGEILELFFGILLLPFIIILYVLVLGLGFIVLVIRWIVSMIKNLFVCKR